MVGFSMHGVGGPPPVRCRCRCDRDLVEEEDLFRSLRAESKSLEYNKEPNRTHIDWSDAKEATRNDVKEATMKALSLTAYILSLQETAHAAKLPCSGKNILIKRY